jgi:hypothetical protein
MENFSHLSQFQKEKNENELHFQWPKVRKECYELPKDRAEVTISIGCNV